MAEVKHLQKIKGLGTLLVCYAFFDEQLNSLKNEGSKYPYAMNLKLAIDMRLKGGPLEGMRTCLAPIYLKGEDPIIVMVSPLITDFSLAKQAVQAHRMNNYFFTENAKMYEDFYKIAKDDENKKPKERRAIIIPSKEKYLIKPDTENNKIADVLFGNKFNENNENEGYFNKFVKPRSLEGIAFYPIAQFNLKDNQTCVNYLWFGGPDFDSGLGGDGRDLGLGSRAFGVLKETSEAGSKNLSMPYS